MTKFNVHLYREMRLCFTGIEADTPEAAAEIACGKHTPDADAVEDCEGENLADLVDVAGDADYSQSVTIDFEVERHRKVASKLLAALKYALEFLEANDDGEDDVTSRIASAQTAIAEANAAGIAPAPADIDVHALVAARRQIALIWSVEDVRAVAPNLTDDQCWEVLQQAERRHDAEIGINWTVLICHVDTLLGEAEGTDAAEGA